MSTRLALYCLAATLTLAACLPGGRRLPQSQLLRLFESKAGRIAFVGVDGNVYITDQAGADSQAVTDDAELTDAGAVLYRAPTWSPESDRLAMIRHTFEGEALVRSALVIGQVEAASTRTVFESQADFPIYASWSPAGDRLGLLTSRQNASGYLLWSVPAETGEPAVVDSGRPVYWSWSPDGGSLLAHIGGTQADNPGLARVTLLEIGAGVRESVLGLDPAYFQAPSVSPHGDAALVAAFVEPGEAALVLTSLRAGTERELARLPGPAAFVFSPAGAHVAYLAYELVGDVLVGRLHVLEVTPSGPVRELLTPNAQVVAFFWSPDGESLLTFGPVPNADGEPSGLLEMQVTEVASGDSRRLGSFRPTEAFADILPFFDQFHQSLSVWSPDSQNIVFPAVTDSGQPAIFVVAASGTLAERGLVPGNFATWSWK